MTRVAVVLLLVPFFAQEEPPRSSKVTAKELRRRMVEAFRESAKAAESRTAWTARFRMVTSNPFNDETIVYSGRVWVKNLGEKGLALYWERERTGSKRERICALHLGDRLSVSEEKAGKVWKGAISRAGAFRFESLLREGFGAHLEKKYTVDIYANARYQKTEATVGDWTHLGFQSKEEFEEWWRNKKVEDPVTGTTSDTSEDRPFREKEDEFDRKNPRNVMPEKGDGTVQKYYGLTLTPKKGYLRRAIRSVSMTLRPGDFLPVRIYVERTNDVLTSLHLEEIRRDPEPEIPDDRFAIDEKGLTIIDTEE